MAKGVNTHKAFIPYIPGTFANCPPDSGTVVQARVTGISDTSIQLDRKVLLDGQQVDSIPYAYLVREAKPGSISVIKRQSDNLS